MWTFWGFSQTKQQFSFISPQGILIKCPWAVFVALAQHIQANLKQALKGSKRLKDYEEQEYIFEGVSDR